MLREQKMLQVPWCEFSQLEAATLGCKLVQKKTLTGQ